MVVQLLPALWKFASGSVRTFWRVGRKLFHEVTGALFGAFAFYGMLAAERAWQRGRVPWLVALAIAYSLLMVIFAAAAFRTARRVR
jgi:hypothetical protein